MRVCLEKSTGKLIEMQSDPSHGTLIQNALKVGYLEADIEEKEVTADEWSVIKERWIDAPGREARAAKMAAKESANAKLVALGFTDDEIESFRG